MTDRDCTKIVELAMTHLSGQFITRPIGEDCLVITPFTNADRAPVEIFVNSVGNEFLLSDEGETLNQLFLNGLTIEEKPDLIQEIVSIAHTHQVDFRDSELFVRTTQDVIGEAIQNIASAMQAVSFLLYKKVHRPHLRFDEEVEQLLISKQIKYEFKYIIKGLASTHTIPFFINSSRNVLLEPVSADTVTSARNKAKRIGYTWGDLQRQHGNAFKYTVIVDNQKSRQREIWQDLEALSPLTNYSTSVYYWTEDQPKLVDLLTT